jgi:Ran GTPase-activating protein 1
MLASFSLDNFEAKTNIFISFYMLSHSTPFAPFSTGCIIAEALFDARPSFGISSPSLLKMNYSIEGLGLKLNTHEDIAPYLSQIEPNIMRLEEIHLCGNTIGVGAAQALAEILQKASAIRVCTVYMSHSACTQFQLCPQVANFADVFTGRLIAEIPTALSAICDSLIDKEHLVEVNLSDNAFGGRSVDPIVPFLSKNTSFQILWLNNNGLGPEGGTVIANALRDNAAVRKAIPEKDRSGLRTVICGRNRLEDGSAPAWAEAFAAHGTLVEVRLPQNGIRMDGSIALAEGLAKNPALEWLDLQDNTLSQSGDQAFATALPSWPNLRTLNFSDCVLSEEGEIPQVVEALANGSNPRLRTLQLQNDNLENGTVAVLARAIGTHLKEVTRIEFQENDADEDDAGIELLKENLIMRGGKFLFSDEDEDEGEDTEDELQDAEEGDVSAEFVEASEGEDEEADQLASLLDKVSLTTS